MSGTLSPQVASIALAIGIVLALCCYLVTNLSPGGMITPGWLAVAFLEDIQRVPLIFGMTVATWISTILVQKWVILYGKRLFASVILISVVYSLGIYLVVHGQYPLLFAQQTLGFIIPGLIAYQLVRQPRVPTIACTCAVTLGAYGLLASGILLDLVPAT
ncbi:Poly-gamma-glutamate synthesis protein PgsC OS=Tsukamurella paurometabola (strain ATCC 8368 / DSM / CCUG 35730 / CIP 100753 / JCM 10117 / KCTC 9821 / NBRC 16120 / NCIMB 702349 / NCTC 13040) OX=521096 GN=Tpau_0306 PE=4 SV=1 [Tsukamurella paurometabola]|uniref:Poly-gamma-glutamate synthesis protein PgsC n=1 Tax=Tsukamurella paurometabola (strain ATCC 8368 / DSM 20162 / CCUG 35730 / CIP 100753 / JCM 10117 / KCTC 9821 / NBRC 16120 / NCIMB 702349 / NCTC 13040) TaxID=521096 RepID=D5UR99_TSUPD|nr:poly-gamma-glutamate biosynthesis protein PgsC/CapC [Tsukamurella paurometabola]ADG76952.1 poly-gamma-glutamate synthesis protein PgsC [Tsukamurella paurometabola DSM 20162]SUP42312.1 poly-gamma-glutamate biosynthesis protein PgsC [Tsukamurella paurometabola]